MLIIAKAILTFTVLLTIAVYYGAWSLHKSNSLRRQKAK